MRKIKKIGFFFLFDFFKKMKIFEKNIKKRVFFKKSGKNIKKRIFFSNIFKFNKKMDFIEVQPFQDAILFENEGLPQTISSIILINKSLNLTKILYKVTIHF